MMKRGDKEVPAIYFNVYKQENVSGNGPTHTWKNYEVRERIVIEPGRYDVKFFPSSLKNQNQGNLKIEKAGQKKPQQDQVYGTQNYPSPSADLDMLDDDLNR